MGAVTLPIPNKTRCYDTRPRRVNRTEVEPDNGPDPLLILFTEANDVLRYCDLAPNQVDSTWYNRVIEGGGVIYEEKAMRIGRRCDRTAEYVFEVRFSIHFNKAHIHSTSSTFQEALAHARALFFKWFKTAPERVKDARVALAEARQHCLFAHD